MILQCFLRGIGLSFRDAFSKVELSYKCAAEQSFLPRSGLGIKPGVSNPRLRRVLSCPEGTPENLAFYQRELLFPSEFLFFLIDTDL